MFGSPQHRDEEMGQPAALGEGGQLLKEVIKNIYKTTGGVERHCTPANMPENMMRFTEALTISGQKRPSFEAL